MFQHEKIFTYYWQRSVSVPCAPLHEIAGVCEGVYEEKEHVPETRTGVHAHEVQTPILTDVVDDCSQQQRPRNK